MNIDIQDGTPFSGTAHTISGPLVTAGPHEDREKLLGSTFGSVDFLWSEDDEFRFSEAQGKLISVTLQVPDGTPQNDWDPETWLSIPPRRCEIFANNHNNFDTPPMDIRWLSHEAENLVCTYYESPAPNAECLRVRIADRLDLVFDQNKLIAWILEDPCQSLTTDQNSLPPTPCGRTTRELYIDYMSITSESEFEAIQDGDCDALGRLAGILNRAKIEKENDPRMHLLEKEAKSLLEMWGN